MTHLCTVVEVAPGVHFAETSLVNWVVLSDDAGVTLIDTGYPGHHDAVLDSIREAGRQPEELRAILLTHAHIDHLGSSQRLADAYQVPIYAHPDEHQHAVRNAHYGLDAAGLISQLWRPRVARWFAEALPVGVADKHGVVDVTAFPALGEPLALPGRPVVLACPGHTPGHCAYQLADHDIVITGDALITAHPTSKLLGPQLLPDMFDHDRAQTIRTLRSLRDLPATLVLPGHGPAYRGPIGDAIDRALARSG